MMKKGNRIALFLLAAAIGICSAGAAAAAVKGPGKFLAAKKNSAAASWKEAYPDGLSAEADVLSYLNGTWCFLNNGNI